MSRTASGDYSASIANAIAFVRKHATATFAVASFAAIVGRILGIAKFDAAVALSIAGFADPPKVILGMVIDVSSTVLLALAMTAIALGFLRPKDRGPVFPREPAIIVILIVVLMSPLSYVVVLGIFALLVLGLRGRVPSTDETVSGWLLAAMVASIAAVVLTPVPWTPAERIDAAGTITVGYVLGFSGDWAAVLTEDQREVVMIRQGEISSRTPCLTNARPLILPREVRQTLIDLLAQRQPAMETCNPSS